MNKWQIHRKLTPAKIVTIYTLVGGLWIVCSDKLLSIFFKNPAVFQLTYLQTIKGWVYVIITALLLYKLISLYAAALYRSQKALKMQEERLAAIIETTTNAIVVYNNQGYITMANPAAEKILGFNRSQLIGQSYHEEVLKLKTLEETPFPEEQHPFVQVMKKETTIYEIECKWIHPQGNDRFLLLNSAPLYDPTGLFEGVVMSITDMTEQRQAEMLRRARDMADARNQAKSDFLANMSHELRTPLNAILGLSQMLQRQLYGELNAKQKEYIDAIRSSSDHLLSLINDILDLSKVEAGKQELCYTEIIVADLCKYCLKIVQERAYEKGIQLTQEIDSEVKTCMADERRLKQILLNLLSNAVKFTPEGEVSLIVKKQSQGIAFTVADTGIGIAAENLPLIFEPFQQIENALNAQVQGTGLGLALTRNLVQLHGREITVESILNQGSRFTICLPDLPPSYVQSLEDCSENEGVYELGGRSGRILIADSDFYNAMLLKDYLQVLGYTVKHLSKVNDFLNQVQSFNPQLILMEMQFSQKISGLDLIYKLRQTSAFDNVRIIVITAMAMSSDREQCLKAGADDYLSKPIRLVQIESLLLKYLPAT